MALAIDASSPAVANAATGTTATVTTASFTPPANSLLVVLWAGDIGGGITPGTAPTITDSLGTPLTYTLQQWERRGSTASVNGQAAIWTAPVATSAAMTITVTNGTANDNSVKVLVITDSSQPTVGTSSKNGQSTGTTVAMSYTATAAGSWGFSVISDWDGVATETAGTGTTLIGSALVNTNYTYGFYRRTTADGVSGSTTTLNANLSVASANLQWAAVEILPAAGGTNYTAQVDDPAGLTDTTAVSIPTTWTFTHNVTVG